MLTTMGNGQQQVSSLSGLQSVHLTSKTLIRRRLRMMEFSLLKMMNCRHSYHAIWPKHYQLLKNLSNCLLPQNPIILY
jgi:hypothetical protein